MSGAFQTSREIFNNPIWKNIVDFRLFFLVYGNAIFAEEGYRVSEDLHLDRGQWCRSIRKLQEDLTYFENRQIKTYSTSVISRCIKRLVDSQRVCTRLHELGTVFTVVNYEDYQGLSNYKKDNLERNLEQSGNSEGTVGEQSGNNNKKVKKVKKVKEEIINILYGDFVQMTSTQYDNLIKDLGEDITKKYILSVDDWFAQDENRLKNYSDHSRMIRTWKRNDDSKANLPAFIKTASRNNVHSFNRKSASGKVSIQINNSPSTSTPLSEERREAMRAKAMMLDGTVR